MQPIMRWACEKLEGFWRIIVADVFLFVSFVGTVNGENFLILLFIIAKLIAKIIIIG
jgi:hypothetical protein